ncbi:MAG: antibiotic biosynthesis monooxygenase [Pseudomonadota bacterium]
MIQEIALLDVIPGQEDAFLHAFEGAQVFLQDAAGYQRHSLSRCIERPSRFLLSVWWDSVDSHEVGFRQSEAYAGWKAALHHFYDPFPTVEHFSLPVLPSGPGDGS